MCEWREDNELVEFQGALKLPMSSLINEQMKRTKTPLATKLHFQTTFQTLIYFPIKFLT